MLGTHVWPWPTRPRVVVEDPLGDRAFATATALRQAGYSVAVCRGPSAERRERCSLVDDLGCAIVDGADAVVFRLDLERAEAGWVLTELRRCRPGTPVVAVVSRRDAARRAAELTGCEVVDDTAPPEELVAAVDRARAEHADASPRRVAVVRPG